MIPVWAQDDTSHLNSILMLGYFVDWLTLVFALRYWYWKLVKIPSFGCTKYPCGVFLRNNGSFDELRHRRFMMTIINCFRGMVDPYFQPGVRDTADILAIANPWQKVVDRKPFFEWKQPDNFWNSLFYIGKDFHFKRLYLVAASIRILQDYNIRHVCQQVSIYDKRPFIKITFFFAKI